MSPNRVELMPHDPVWVPRALAEAASLRGVLGDVLLVVHHIGSTAISGIHAKPVIDLMPVVRTLPALEVFREGLQALGYEWCGEFGLTGRRYCRKDDPVTGKRVFQLHAYAEGDNGVLRHLAFRDYLRKYPAVATDYDIVKTRCQRQHPEDSHAYSACKADWIGDIEARALQSLATASTTTE